MTGAGHCDQRGGAETRNESSGKVWGMTVGVLAHQQRHRAGDLAQTLPGAVGGSHPVVLRLGGGRTCQMPLPTRPVAKPVFDVQLEGLRGPAGEGAPPRIGRPGVVA